MISTLPCECAWRKMRFKVSCGWFVRLGLLTTLFGAGDAAAMTTTKADEHDDRPLHLEGIGNYRSCASFSGGGQASVTLSPGVASVLRPIECETPLTVEIKGEVVVRSHTTLQTTGVRFLVHPTGSLLVTAPAIELTRSEDLPVFTVNGRLTLEATGYSPSLVSGASEHDEHDLVAVGPGGRVYSSSPGQAVRYSESSVKVAGVTPTEERVSKVRHKPVELPPSLTELLATYHAKLSESPDEDLDPDLDLAAGDPASGADDDDDDDDDDIPRASTTFDQKADVTTTTVDEASGSNAISRVPAAAAAPYVDPSDASYDDVEPIHIIDQSFTFENGVLRKCDDIPPDATFSGGLLNILRSIDCAGGAKYIKLAGDTRVRSHADIFTRDIAWIVEPDVTVVFEAETVTLSRTEVAQEVGMPVLAVEGTVEFDVSGWVPAHADGFLKDGTESGLLWIDSDTDGGVFSRHGVLHYTEDSIIVANPIAAGEPKVNDDVPGSRYPHDPALLHFLDDMHTKLRGDDRVSGGSGSSSGTAKETRSLPFASATADDGSDGSPSIPSGAGGGGGSPSFNFRVNKSFVDFMTKKMEGHFGHHSRASSTTDSTTNGSYSGGGGDDGEDDGSSSSSSSSSRHSGGGGGGSGRGRDADGFDLPLPEMSFHPDRMLRVEDKLTGKLVSPDGTSVVFPNPEDASMMLYRPARGSSSLANEVLIEADPRVVKRVKDTRKDVEEEDARILRGLGPQKRGLAGSVKWWWTRGDRELARENLGESYLTITKRGVVEGYLDGRRVLAKGGPSWFGLRRSRADREVWATASGMEERTKDGRRLWGIDIDN